MSALMLFLPAAWTFIKAHWRPFAVVVAVLAAFLAGRCSSAKSDVKSTVVKVAQTSEKQATTADENKTEQKQETKTVIVYLDRKVNKDGSSETKEEIQQTSGQVDHVTDNTVTKQTDVKTSTETTKQTTTVTSRARRNWYVYADIGAPIALKAPFFGTPFVVLGINHTIPLPFVNESPLSGGVWGSVDMHGQAPAFGVSLGVSF